MQKNQGFFGGMNRQQKRSLSKSQQLVGIEQLASRVAELTQKCQKADQDVDTLLGMLTREKLANSAAVEKGDTLVIGLVGSLFLEDGTVGKMPFQGGVADNLLISSLGSGELIPGLEETIIMKNVTDQFTVDITFPEQYHALNLAGKKAQFFIVIHSAFRKTATTSVITDRQNELIKSLLEDQAKEQANAQESKDESGVQIASGEAAQ